MYKIKTTNKEIRKSLPWVVCAGYCDLQFLLNYECPIAYTSGVYGWNYDVYKLPGGLLLATGYRGTPGKRAALIPEYEKTAEYAYYNRGIAYDERREALRNLLVEFASVNEPCNAPAPTEPDPVKTPVLCFYLAEIARKEGQQ